MNDMTSAPDVGQPAKRGKNRDSLFLTATLRLVEEAGEAEVRVRNLSEGGMMAETSMRATQGAALEINLRNVGWVTGRVAWLAEGRIGVAFDHNIDPVAVRKPVGQGNIELPSHLRKLNSAQSNRSAIRRV